MNKYMPHHMRECVKLSGIFRKKGNQKSASTIVLIFCVIKYSLLLMPFKAYHTEQRNKF